MRRSSPDRVPLRHDLPKSDAVRIICKPFMVASYTSSRLRSRRLSLPHTTSARLLVLGIAAITFAIAPRRLIGEDSVRVDNSIRIDELKRRRVGFGAVGGRNDADARRVWDLGRERLTDHVLVKLGVGRGILLDLVAIVFDKVFRGPIDVVDDVRWLASKLAVERRTRDLAIDGFLVLLLGLELSTTGRERRQLSELP
jgi:hypothetical protein